MFSILTTFLTDKPLILQWEVWLRSLLGLKGLNGWRTVNAHLLMVVSWPSFNVVLVIPVWQFTSPTGQKTFKEFLNPFTPRVKPCVMQNVLIFNSTDRTLKCDHSLESCWAVLDCGFFNFTQFIILENWSILGFARSGVKGITSGSPSCSTNPHLLRVK